MIEENKDVLLLKILERLETLEKQITILDKNIKILMNSSRTISKPSPKPEPKPIVENKASGGFKHFSFEPSNAIKESNTEVKQSMPKTSVVSGKMVANLEGRVTPLANISVKIYNEKDVLVKETRTNRAGEWRSFLGAGKYVALFNGEINGKKLVPQNRNFVVIEGKAETEVV